MVSYLRTLSTRVNSCSSPSDTSFLSLMRSISSIRLPNIVPWPQPVVTVRLPIFFFRSLTPLRVVMAQDSVSQSTCTATTSLSAPTRRWLRR